MSAIIFKGKMTKGCGKYVELHVPGRNELSNAPADWPEVLYKGSLNVRIMRDGYPSEFSEAGLELTTRSLDEELFSPAFTIEQRQFGNNKLKPKPEMPKRGSAQVWRAKLTTNQEDFSCWVLRRFGSGLLHQLELLSGQHLRKACGLEDDQDVTVTLNLQ